MATDTTTLWLVQNWSDVLRPGNAEDGPPYAPPGDWLTIGSHTTRAAAKAGLARVENTDFGHRHGVKRRIVEVKPDAKTRPRRIK